MSSVQSRGQTEVVQKRFVKSRQKGVAMTTQGESSGQQEVWEKFRKGCERWFHWTQTFNRSGFLHSQSHSYTLAPVVLQLS